MACTNLGCAVAWEWLDLRVGQKFLTAGNITFDKQSEKMSKELGETCRVVAPPLIKLGTLLVAAGAAADVACGVVEKLANMGAEKVVTEALEVTEE